MSPHLSRDQWSRLEICLLHSWRQSVQSLIDSISRMYIFAWLFSFVLLLLVMCNLMSAVSSKKKVCCFSDSARCQSKSFSFFSSQPHLVSKAKRTIDFGGLNKWLFSVTITKERKQAKLDKETNTIKSNIHSLDTIFYFAQYSELKLFFELSFVTC